MDCVIGIAAVVIVGYFVLRRRRRGKIAQTGTGDVAKEWREDRKADNSTYSIHELPEESAVSEVEGNHNVHELRGKNVASELSS